MQRAHEYFNVKKLLYFNMSDEIDHNLYPHPGILNGLTVEKIHDYSMFALLRIEHFWQELESLSSVSFCAHTLMIVQLRFHCLLFLYDYIV